MYQQSGEKTAGDSGRGFAVLYAAGIRKSIIAGSANAGMSGMCSTRAECALAAWLRRGAPNVGNAVTIRLIPIGTSLKAERGAIPVR